VRWDGSGWGLGGCATGDTLACQRGGEHLPLPHTRAQKHTELEMKKKDEQQTIAGRSTLVRNDTEIPQILICTIPPEN
jgi:hypothetical protein